MQFEWSYLQRVFPEHLILLQNTCRLRTSFFLALLGGPVSEAKACLFLLPAHIGGLGISDPVNFASSAYSSSREGTTVLVHCIREGRSFDVSVHLTQLTCVCIVVNSPKDSHFQSILTFGNLLGHQEDD